MSNDTAFPCSDVLVNVFYDDVMVGIPLLFSLFIGLGCASDGFDQRPTALRLVEAPVLLVTNVATNDI